MFGASEHLGVFLKLEIPFHSTYACTQPPNPEIGNLGVTLSDGGNLFFQFTPSGTEKICLFSSFYLFIQMPLFVYLKMPLFVYLHPLCVYVEAFICLFGCLFCLV